MITEQQLFRLGYRPTNKVNIAGYLNMTYYRHPNGETVAKDPSDVFYAVMPDEKLKGITSIEQLEDIFDRLRKE